MDKNKARLITEEFDEFLERMYAKHNLKGARRSVRYSEVDFRINIVAVEILPTESDKYQLNYVNHALSLDELHQGLAKNGSTVWLRDEEGDWFEVTITEVNHRKGRYTFYWVAAPEEGFFTAPYRNFQLVEPADV